MTSSPMIMHMFKIIFFRVASPKVIMWARNRYYIRTFVIWSKTNSENAHGVRAIGFFQDFSNSRNRHPLFDLFLSPFSISFQLLIIKMHTGVQCIATLPALYCCVNKRLRALENFPRGSQPFPM